MKKALVLLGESKYNVLVKAAELVAKGIEKCGYSVYIVNVVSMIENHTLEEFDYDEYDVIFSCQAVLSDWCGKDEKGFLANYRGKYIGWIFDDFMYHMDRISQFRYNHTYLLTIDEQFPKYICEILPEILHCGFLPHGGFQQKTSIDIGEKNIDILVSGNLGEMPEITDYISDPMPIELDIIKKSLHYLECNTTHSVRQAVEHVMLGLGGRCDGGLWRELHGCMRYIDQYIRFVWKKRIIDCLIQMGLQVHIVGEGYSIDEYLQQNNVTVHGGMDVDEFVDMVGKSKIVVNTSLTLTGGIHERIATALLGKAICFSPECYYLRDNFSESVHCIDLLNLQAMTDKILEILENYESYQKQLEDSYLWALENHTWEVRGQQMIEMLSTES